MRLRRGVELGMNLLRQADLVRVFWGAAILYAAAYHAGALSGEEVGILLLHLENIFVSQNNVSHGGTLTQ
jgi:hypothetical protein